MKLRSRLKTDTSVPMSAMADIAFLLIAFFMLTSTFSKDTGLDITLPIAQESQELPKRDVTVWITRSGEVHINKTIVPADPGQIVAALTEALRDESVQSVTIRGDQGVPYGDVVRVMDVAKQSGAAITLAAVFEEQ
ncbi:MAG TPA: biopolymer transporter ExbD [Armatimonadota bacterium]|nr:biopolymer transporter ExbD [Armatimonadota bacterium]